MHKKEYWFSNVWIRILLHVLFITLSFFVLLKLFKNGPEAEKVDFIYTAIFLATIFPAVYINLEILLPRFAKSLTWHWYAVSILILVFVFTWINISFFQKWSSDLLPGYFFISYYTWWEIILFFLIFLAITTLLKLSKSWFMVNDLSRELLQSEKQKIQIELKALKAQVNPHFFFNTLNNIYSMSLDKDQRLPGTILQLSELMRYFLYESKEDFVPLDKELQVLQDYISLQSIRVNEKFGVEQNMDGEVKNEKIAPLLLITFLENAFKHGAKSGPAFVKLFIRIRDGQLDFRVENTRGIIDHSGLKEHTGVGLENVKRQLELLYPGRHTLMIDNRGDLFIIHLQLKL